ncbi:MAG: glycosyltransferase, partial [Methanobacteriota archaeon]
MEKKGTVEANRVYLNIGSGDKKLEGFINIDMIPGADIQADVTKGLPFPDNSVDGIFSEHFIEHISQADGINFFRECRRVLKPGGRVRVATPDLDHIVQRYLSNDWKSESEMFNRGMEYVQNTCEQLNLSLRSWGHQWVYNEEELVRVATTAGLKPVGRCEWGKSDYPGFQGLEYRAGSRLIFEFEKSQHQYTEATPLVSILIPAYKPTYLEEALQSALQQTYPNVEIILCDDSGGKEIEKIVKKYLKKAPNLKYVKNPENIGGRKNYLQCFELAQGTFIKFLNDDDRLAPNCVERMVECFLTYPDITMVTSYRKLIDEQGNELPDQSFNTPIVNQDAIIEGLSLANAMLTHRINVVGEPTTTMFRKADALTIKPHIFSMGGRPALANGDVNLWVNLLGKGNAVYIVEPLSYFRLHDQQVQKQAEFQNRALKGWDQL